MLRAGKADQVQIPKLEVVVLDEDGRPVELSPVIRAMCNLVVSQRDAIEAQSRGDLRIHYINESRKVYGTLEKHVGFVKF